jgi:hypothetical protein
VSEECIGSFFDVFHRLSCNTGKQLPACNIIQKREDLRTYPFSKTLCSVGGTDDEQNSELQE